MSPPSRMHPDNDPGQGGPVPGRSAPASLGNFEPASARDGRAGGRSSRAGVAVAVAVLVGGLAPGPAEAVPLDGRYGVGYAQAIGGPAGLAINLGLGNFIIETLLGFEYETFGDSGRASAVGLQAGAGGHFQLLRAQRASLTAGARLNLLTGRTDAASGQGTTDVFQWGVDLPVRVYWFPDEHLSVHTEFGLSIQVGSEDGVLTDGLTPSGLKLDGFGGTSLFGGLGLTFWWG